jgi:GNAT superfamily N-acetyltransferase
MKLFGARMKAVRKPTRVWYLEMREPGLLRPARTAEDVHVAHAEVPVGALNRFFYLEVGRDHEWIDLATWSAEQWQRHAERMATWIAWHRGTPAGYGELDRRPDGTVNLAYFGLLKPFQGRGIGGHALSEIVRGAWAAGAARVTLNTCELDGPHALANYQARGFTVIRETVEQRSRGPRPADAS